MRAKMIIPALFVGVLLTTVFLMAKDEVYKMLPNDMKWQQVPVLPKDLQISVVSGDLQKAGPIVLRLKAPAGSVIPPHWHKIDENVTVLSGSINVGEGDKLDKNASIKIPQGGFVKIPANHHHYAWFDEDSVVQLNDYGLWEIFYVNPEEDPRNQ